MASGLMMVPPDKSKPKIKHHNNKGSKITKFAGGGSVPSVRNALPKAARAVWDRIPSVKEFARTGKVFPSSEDVDRADRRENAYETNKRK